MAKCPVRVQNRKNKSRNCGCDAKVLYRVRYGKLFPHREKEGKYDDLFGVCPDHADRFADPREWYAPCGWQGVHREKTVHGLRGTVESVERVEVSLRELEEVYRSDERLTIAAECKKTIKRMMVQQNTARLTDDDWRALFRECLEEHTVEQVMDA